MRRLLRVLSALGIVFWLACLALPASAHAQGTSDYIPLSLAGLEPDQSLRSFYEQQGGERWFKVPWPRFSALACEINGQVVDGARRCAEHLPPTLYVPFPQGSAGLWHTGPIGSLQSETYMQFVQSAPGSRLFTPQGIVGSLPRLSVRPRETVVRADPRIDQLAVASKDMSATLKSLSDSVGGIRMAEDAQNSRVDGLADTLRDIRAAQEKDHGLVRATKSELLIWESRFGQKVEGALASIGARLDALQTANVSDPEQSQLERLVRSIEALRIELGTFKDEQARAIVDLANRPPAIIEPRSVTVEVPSAVPVWSTPPRVLAWIERNWLASALVIAALGVGVMIGTRTSRRWSAHVPKRARGMNQHDLEATLTIRDEKLNRVLEQLTAVAVSIEKLAEAVTASGGSRNVALPGEKIMLAVPGQLGKTAEFTVDSIIPSKQGWQYRILPLHPGVEPVNADNIWTHVADCGECQKVLRSRGISWKDRRAAAA